MYVVWLMQINYIVINGTEVVDFIADEIKVVQMNELLSRFIKYYAGGSIEFGIIMSD